MIGVITLVVLTILALVAQRFFGAKIGKQYIPALYLLILLDALCVRYLFPYLPGIDSHVTLGESVLIASVSALVIGVLVVEFIGNIAIFTLGKIGVSDVGVAKVLVKNTLYLLPIPFANAVALIAWTLLFPNLGFKEMWPSAIFAGLILNYLDISIVVPWFFHLTKALQKAKEKTYE